ncbi:hypothetical protein FALCPG4_011838 [Fusarium falciforme]
MDVIVLVTKPKRNGPFTAWQQPTSPSQYHGYHVIIYSFNTAVASFSPITLKVQSCLDTTKTLHPSLVVGGGTKDAVCALASMLVPHKLFNLVIMIRSLWRTLWLDFVPRWALLPG